ncbi:hypothetical protein AHiyo6_19800, partial [Arthrobacter sp. Hiyo6]
MGNNSHGAGQAGAGSRQGPG